MTGPRLPAALAGLAVLLVAGWLRFAHLGRPSFGVDEYLHVFSAQQLQDGHGPRLPSGHLYHRASAYTWTVAGSFALAGVSEASARASSALFGMLVVWLTFVAGRRWFGLRPGLAAAALVAVWPDLVEASRACRMYSLFHLLYLGALVACQRAEEPHGAAWPRRVGWAVLALTLAGLSYHIHELTLSLLPALALYWAGSAVRRPRGGYALALLGLAGTSAAAVMMGWLDPAELWRRAHYAPAWAGNDRENFAFYLRHWQRFAPWLWALPIAAAFTWRRHGRLGWFVVCQLVVPLALHSFVFEWKVPRYVGHLVPLVALLVAPALVEGAQALASFVRTQALRAVRWRRALMTAAGGAAAALAVAALLTPLTRSVALQADRRKPRWREAHAFLGQAVRPGDVIVASIPLATQYYLGRPATHVMSNYLMDFKRGMATNAEGLWVDWYSGLPLVTSPEQFQLVYAAAPRGWIVTPRSWFDAAAAVPTALQEAIRAQCRSYEAVEDGSVLIFGWDRSQADGERT